MNENLNPIKKIIKWNILRRLDKEEGIESFLNIKDKDLKNDRDIIDKAWSKVYASRKYENLNLFPENIKQEKASQDVSIIRYFDDQTQYNIAIKDKKYLLFCLEHVQERLVTENPLEYMKIAKREVQEKIMPQLDEDIQRKLISNDPQLILFSDATIKKDILAQKYINSMEWQAIISNEPDMNLKKLFSYLERSMDSSMFDLDEIMNIFNNLEDKKEIVSQVGQLNIGQRRIVIEKLCAKYVFADIDSEFQSVLFDILVENSDLLYLNSSEGKVANGSYIWNKFDVNILFKKFEQKYGNEKLEQYKDLLNQLYGELDTKLIKLLFVDESIIKKVSSAKVIEYINIWKNLEHEEYLLLERHLPFSLEAKRKRNELKEKFNKIIYEGYGKKAGKLCESRPGLTIRDIENAEVLNQTIFDNFRDGFVHDLLSYDIWGINDFIKISKNEEEMNAFKLLYERMSNRFGENVATMQMCIDRYYEFSSILKDACRQDLNDEQLEQLDIVCSWPINICNITRIKDLKDLSSKFVIAINEYKHWKDKRIIDEKLEGDIMATNFEGELILYDYLNPENIQIPELSPEEQVLLKHLQNNPEDRFSIDSLKKASNNGVDISSVFLCQYSFRKKIKENVMSEFNKELTNLDKIKTAEQTGEYGTKTMKIGDVELIDFGSMPVNFASHYPNMENSNVSFYGKSPMYSDEKNQYLLYDGEKGISTISATPFAEKTGEIPSEMYIYWSFEANEIMALKNGSASEFVGDSGVSHMKKQVISTGQSNISLRGYKTIKYGTEIAFYRRFRNHKTIENSGYGGKIIPDAVTLSVSKENIISSMQTFGQIIPFVVPRGALSNEKRVAEYRAIILEAMKEMNYQETGKKDMIGENTFAEEVAGISVDKTIIDNAYKTIRNAREEEQSRYYTVTEEGRT